ncbi:group II intron maturase-specific domain-containing protein [Bradyrhizobium sp. CSA112]|uniref:group II intron maturase-specific domain-containing protein n=1 Tax=Bradyrhizobium sp. CSA112 TaxID=2699170 RepID=UPI0023B195FE|nr:group II intron maturase-specific domain-containing protein [Bradyrhizobium sp. CSA112]
MEQRLPSLHPRSYSIALRDGEGSVSLTQSNGRDLSPHLIGWLGYFGFCQTPRVLTNLEAWIRRRLRMYLWRQWQNGHPSKRSRNSPIPRATRRWV